MKRIMRCNTNPGKTVSVPSAATSLSVMLLLSECLLELVTESHQKHVAYKYHHSLVNV